MTVDLYKVLGVSGKAGAVKSHFANFTHNTIVNDALFADADRVELSPMRNPQDVSVNVPLPTRLRHVLFEGT
jgi:hypothetical protein